MFPGDPYVCGLPASCHSFSMESPEPQIPACVPVLVLGLEVNQVWDLVGLLDHLEQWLSIFIFSQRSFVQIKS